AGGGDPPGGGGPGPGTAKDRPGARLAGDQPAQRPRGLTAAMLRYPAIDPVAVELGPLQVHWYGLMYLLGFAAAWLLALRRSRQPGAPVAGRQVVDLGVDGARGVVLGGGLGCGLSCDLACWLADPRWILRIWEGGMAFHGGLLGVLVALWLYARKIGRPLL